MMTDSPSAPVGAAVSEAAHQHAQAWMHAYGILTERYTAGGGDHPMMDTLPAAFEAYAAAARGPSPAEVKLRAENERLRQGKDRFKTGVRAAITWLHGRAWKEMVDPRAQRILDSAATHLGWDLAAGRVPQGALRDPDASGAPVNASTPPVNASKSPKPPNVDTSAGHVDGADIRRRTLEEAADIASAAYNRIYRDRQQAQRDGMPNIAARFEAAGREISRVEAEIRALAPSDAGTSTGGGHGE